MHKTKFSRTISIPVTESMYQFLKQISDEQEIGISELVRNILDYRCMKESEE
jgi:hypothetical protein